MDGDADTRVAVAGAIGRSFHRDPPAGLVSRVRALFTPDLVDIIDDFEIRDPA